MEYLIIDNNTNKSLRYKTEKGSKLCAPVILCAAIALSLSYIIDYFYFGSNELAMGETSAIARIFYRCGTLINKLIYTVISGGIALYSGGLGALPAGLIGGMLTGMGFTLSFPSGNSEAMTGIYGCIITGLIAGYSVAFIEKIINNTKKQKKSFSFMLSPAVSISITILFIIIADILSHIINGLSSAALATTGERNKLLLAVLLSVMITVDIGGPLYLASLVYSVAAFTTNEPQITALVTAAGCVPVLSIGLSAILFKDRFTKKERYYSVIGMLCGLFGINQVAIPFYASKLYRVIFPGVIGGTISGCLCYAFGCSSASTTGGILTITGTLNVLYYLIAVSCGTLFSTGIMGYFLYHSEEKNMRNNYDTELKTETIPA